MNYYYHESIEGFDIYVSNGLEDIGSIVEHIGVIYEEVHAKIICRILNDKAKSIGELDE